ncbi:hypothetical protein NECAME_09924 [Necator americanus]|uniref:Surfactant protein B n=1 Tax=Necator americanus TaxID=51031 RepID=W2TDD9_NECAM|nr:hypothetical protein NECAME_09924 [Necator americanus]ETN79206.1 hypothetical protein NECAME_09924 [Necator americanus]
MRRLLFGLLLTVTCSAQFFNEDIVKYGQTLFNDCTTCHLEEAVKQHPDLMETVISKIPILPSVFRADALIMVRRWEKKIVESPASDCRKICEALETNTTGCGMILTLSEHMSKFLIAIQEETKKICNDEKKCLEQQRDNILLISATIKDIIRALASAFDPHNRCGVDGPSSALGHFELSKLYTNGQFLNCQLCYSFLQFLDTAIAGGQTNTSKTILNAIGVAARDVCVAINLPALLHLLVPALGDLQCTVMPEVIIFVFQFVISPKLGAEAQQTCSALYSYCSDVFDQ